MHQPTEIILLSREVLDDIRSAAWLESETHPECNRHRRHEMADICEKDNVELVWRILGICDAEFRFALRRHLVADDDLRQQNALLTPSEWRYAFRSRLQPHVAALLKEKMHAYMLGRVLSDRLKVFIPEAYPLWGARAQEAMSSISNIAGLPADLKPVRRPLFPF